MEQLMFDSTRLDTPDRVCLLDLSLLPPERLDVLAVQIRKLQVDGDPLDVARDVASTLPPNLPGADLSAIGECRVVKGGATSLQAGRQRSKQVK